MKIKTKQIKLAMTITATTMSSLMAETVNTNLTTVVLKRPPAGTWRYVEGIDSNIAVRLERVELSEDKFSIIDAIKNDENEWVRQTAVKKLDAENQTLIAEIAKNDDGDVVRHAAVGKLDGTNQTLLVEIAKNDKYDSVRRVAVGKINDTSVLAEIAKNDESESVRRVATERHKWLSAAEKRRQDRFVPMRRAETQADFFTLVAESVSTNKTTTAKTIRVEPDSIGVAEYVLIAKNHLKQLSPLYENIRDNVGLIIEIRGEVISVVFTWSWRPSDPPPTRDDGGFCTEIIIDIKTKTVLWPKRES